MDRYLNYHTAKVWLRCLPTNSNAMSCGLGVVNCKKHQKVNSVIYNQLEFGHRYRGVPIKSIYLKIDPSTSSRSGIKEPPDRTS